MHRKSGMEDRVRKDVQKTLSEALEALARKDIFQLRKISDHTIHNASVFQDKDSISVAVIMYALSKVIDRMATIEPQVIEILQHAKENLENEKLDEYEADIKELIDTISNFDSKLDMYIQKVIQESEIKKGSKLYEHGISLAQTAELLGITQWELMKYIGQTKIADTFEYGVSVQDRLAHTRRLFGL